MGSSQRSTGDRATVMTQTPPLGRLLGQVERQVARLVEKTLASHNLTVDQWRVLDVLADDEGHTMSDIMSAIVVPGPTLTKIVDKLVDAALVYRLVDDNDRRRVVAFLSDKGRRVHADLEPKVAETEAEVLNDLGGDGPVLLELLTQLAQGCAAARPRL